MAKIACDFCAKGTGIIFCCSDEAVLCNECDVKLHSANNLAMTHERVSLIKQELQQKCDVCKDIKGLVFCLEHRLLLCRSCDASTHLCNRLTWAHTRLFVSEIGVGNLTESESSGHSQAFQQGWDDADIFPFNPPSINLCSVEELYDDGRNATDELWSFQAQD